jgi:SMODS-associated and fused to various effectors sensor domain/TIR domain
MTAGPPPGSADASPVGVVRPLAPVFISYRASDGAEIAASLAWALRATGVPVWHDVSDLPPGDTRRRLQEALASGLSGAVLLITPDIRHSEVVREVEVPYLLAHEPDPAFTFAIGSVIPPPGPGGAPAGSLDSTAPDVLLAQPAGTLQRFKRYPVFDHHGIAALAREIAAQRMAAVRAMASPDVVLDIHTRQDPRATISEVPLAVRIRPPSRGQRVPDPDIWPPFAAFLADLPRLLSIAGTQRLRVRGRAHLTVAFALGAAVPTTSGFAVTVEDEKGDTWGDPACQSQDRRFTLREETEAGEPGTAAGAPVAVYVDLVPDAPPGDAFAAHLAAHPGRYASAVRLQLDSNELIRAEDASALVSDLSQKIRACAGLASTHRVHLFLRTPFPVAVLLGRTLNTLQVTLYEWDNSGPAPQYAETVTVASGRGGGPIVPG